MLSSSALGCRRGAPDAPLLLAREGALPYSPRTLMRAAVKLEVTITTDRLVQLPEDLPEGRAEIIVLYPGPEAAEGEHASRRVKRARAGRGRPLAPPGPVRAGRVNYFERLTTRQPVSLSVEASRALDEAERGER